MAESLGQVILDPETDQPVVKGTDESGRALLISTLKKLCPKSIVTREGSFLNLNLHAAMTLRAQADRLALDWSEQAAGMVDNFAAAYATRGRARKRLLQLQQEGIADGVLSDYGLVDRLDSHQRVAVAAMTDPYLRGLCLFDEQGVGKTVMTIHAFDRLIKMGELDIALIFAPKNMLEVWKNEFTRFFDNLYRVKTIAGSKSEKHESLLSPADVYVANYETAYLLESPLRSLLRQNRGRMVLIIDESFFIKNRNSNRAAAVRRLRHLADRCWILCGTPAPNRALDVIHQFDVADGGVTFFSVPIPKDDSLLRTTIKAVVESRGLYLRRSKTEVLPEIPSKTYEQVTVKLERNQAQMYSTQLTELVWSIQSTDEHTFKKNLRSFLARRMKLLEICSHPGQVDANYMSIPAKQVALDQLLKELIGARGEKVVLWSFFRYSIDSLLKRYQRFHPIKLDGSVSDAKKRSRIIEQFQQDSDTRLLICNPAAAGAGITLTPARVAVYESFPVQTAHYLQSLDRIHRRGQTRKTYYYVLISENTIEEEVYLRLLDKERKAMDLFGDPDPGTVTRESMLTELVKSLRRFRVE